MPFEWCANGVSRLEMVPPHSSPAIPLQHIEAHLIACAICLLFSSRVRRALQPTRHVSATTIN